MADKIRVGIVGATVTQGGSGWGANAHVPALKALVAPGATQTFRMADNTPYPLYTYTATPQEAQQLLSVSHPVPIAFDSTTMNTSVMFRITESAPCGRRTRTAWRRGPCRRTRPPRAS